MRLIGYARSATGDTEQARAQIAVQEGELHAHALEHGYELVDIEVDEAVSGRSLERPGLQRVLQLVDQRAIDGVIVTDLHRVSRRVGHTSHLLRRCKDAGVALLVVRTGLDVSVLFE